MAKVFFPVKVSKHVLEWAKRRSGRSQEYLMKHFPDWDLWINSESQPTFSQIEELAKKTYTPLIYFFKDKPPEIKLPLADFRKITNKDSYIPSSNLLATIYSMQRRQNWLREYLIDYEYERLPYIGSYKIGDNIERVANAIRSNLGLSNSWACELDNKEDVRSKLRDKIEEAGIFIFINGVVGNNTHRTLDVEEFRGFVLPDKLAPVIFVNNNDAKSAQIFTMAHELAHLWINEEAIFNLDIKSSSDNKIDNKIEKFCDKVSAEFLVPKKGLEKEWLKDSKDSKGIIKSLSQKFKVSNVVIAWRALDIGKINRAVFLKYYEDMKEEYTHKKVNKKDGGSFYHNQGYRVGKRFYSMVYHAVQAGGLLHHGGFRLTGLYGTTFNKYASKLGDKLYDY